MPVSQASKTEPADTTTSGAVSDAASPATVSDEASSTPTPTPTPEAAGPPLAPEVKNVAQLLLKKAPKGYRRLPTPPEYSDGIDLREWGSFAQRPKLARRTLRTAGYERGAVRYWVEPGKRVLMSMVSEFQDADGAQVALWMEELSAVATADSRRFRFRGIPDAVTVRLRVEGQYAHGGHVAKGHRLYIVIAMDIQAGRTGRAVLKDMARRQYQIG